MISWSEIYNVIEAMMPLYVALALGYGSIKWWGIFTAAHSDTINRLAYYFTLSVFCLEFTSQVDPYRMNYRFIGADVVMKAIVVALLAFWVKFSTNGSLVWAITSFSLSNLKNTLVVGVPLIRAMYGQIGVALVIQSFVCYSSNCMGNFIFAGIRISKVPSAHYSRRGRGGERR
ncbi:hypothetical protein V6N13_013980 [Hibiscus sabdariffa]|uniref:PIN-like protein n=1 Tax=Hibiscus sabdariffa TaxID=183260 RepID=A0ABR2RU23_9ROSI